MIARRPFDNAASLFSAADDIWHNLSAADWKEAFSHHPKIGDIKALREKFSSTQSWAEGEQAGARRASEQTLLALATANAEYEARFGYIFIVCATGRSGDEMLALLKQRTQNDPAEEVHLAAEEQQKITHLRLEKLLRDIP